jgi:predicted dinucleotide-binding enzyme
MHVSTGCYEEASIFGDWVFNCTNGTYSIECVVAAGMDNLAGKVLVDMANPLNHSQGFSPVAVTGSMPSLAESLQQALPECFVVIALNHLCLPVLSDPASVNNGTTDLYICGDDERAKQEVANLLVHTLGWKNDCIVDLGGLDQARLTEGLLPLMAQYAVRSGTFKVGMKLFSAPAAPEPEMEHQYEMPTN